MKVSMNHLKEWVDVTISVQELSALFNTHSAEVEEAYRLVDASHLVVGYVQEKTSHPDADKLSVCQVDIGGEISQIVCGAPNVDQGQYVIVSKPGAVLPGDFKIKKSTIRGVESNGMICSLAELGIDKKFVNADGIHVIKEHCKPGDNPIDILELDDEVMALDLTPNRMDLLSVMGVAYDTAAILNLPLKDRTFTVQEMDEPIPVSIRLDTPNCMSYYARMLKDVEIKPSPRWMQSRLIAAGMRPINNVVDITNYVLLETGQPLHAFDYDLLNSDTISVRMANSGETLKTLDEQVRTLTTDDIVITNDKKSVALGGVMGGAETEIGAATKRILLESAVFNPVHIRKTSNRLDLRSEASLRFERKVDPKRTILALEMATSLFQQYASGQVYKGIAKVDNVDYTEPIIEMTLDTINGNLGTNLSSEEVSEILHRLQFKTTTTNNTFHVTIPSRRQDMETYQDIIEEIGRIYGYDKLPLTLPQTVSKGSLTDLQKFKRQLKKQCTALGLNEVITYSLVPEERVNEFSKEPTKHTSVLSPMSQDKSTLTMSPLVGMIDVLEYNIARKNTDLFLFELGKQYNHEETEVLCGTLTGTLSSTRWNQEVETVNFYTVKGLLNAMFESMYLGHLEFVPMGDYANLHPGQSAYIRDYHGVVGFIGKLHPEYEKQHNLSNTYVFQLDVQELFTRQRKVKRLQDINKFPDVERDIAVVVDENVLASELLQVVNKAGKRMLIQSEIFDVYRGKPLEDYQKSVAIRLVFSDPKRTLETKEVDTRVHEILGVLKAKLKAELR
ncbi:phenylalanine--tRNA ligase subunit beta [Candidatus Xianfuyuplasma coldseepsis]|uniref:Phenylalanine--tRNA ligase beta subunit n=1 Tax=Candidatus Xianfuyuplasma coldseepsis TaxID=2782163 RepID=A0A7L7KRW9_9MOLU|nr:phenylalanine--tRNA ligase subunit beta [Xianfuyuplasma coldseepsis]QMS85561.1 phenylalanine--tRNA ligase subunit beta [Xianfuyuplasma coldseepsis]